MNHLEDLKGAVDKHVYTLKFNVPTLIAALWLAITFIITPMSYEVLTSMRGDDYFIITTVFTFTTVVLYLFLRVILVWIAYYLVIRIIHKYLEKENETK